MAPSTMQSASLKTDTSYQLIQVEPITGAIGAEIRGVDLSRPLSAELKREIVQAFHDHTVVYFPEQPALTAEQHLAFASIFGPTMRIPHLFGIEGYEDVQVIRREAAERDTAIVGGNWHTDSTFLEAPPAAVVLRGVQIPAVGGDTLFSSQYRAYEALSPKMKEVLGGLRAVHSASWLLGNAGKSRETGYSDTIRRLDSAATEREITHPVICTHPATGRKFIFVNTVFVRRFDGMTAEESKPILDFLFAHCARQDFGCRVRWRQNQVLIWDNIASQHKAIGDYPGQERELQRVTIAGERMR
jgi:alpha-ketoglutarate-dependent taurine dioxygenase